MRINVIDGSVEPIDRLKAALEASGVVGTWLWDHRNDTVVYDKSAAELLTGNPALAEQAISGDAAITAVHPVDRLWLREHMREAGQADGLILAEYRVVAGGRERWIMSRGRAERNETGQPICTRGILLDISETYTADIRHLTSERGRDSIIDDLDAIADLAIFIKGRMRPEMHKMLHSAVDLLLFRIGCEIAQKAKSEKA